MILILYILIFVSNIHLADGLQIQIEIVLQGNWLKCWLQKES